MKVHEKLMSIHLEEIQFEIENLSRGGCGWFAWEVSKRLTERKIKHKIQIVAEIEDFDSNAHALNSGYYNLSDEYYWTHFVIRIGDYVLDKDGVCHVDDFSYGYDYDSKHLFDVRKDRMPKWVREGCWNYYFDQSTVPTLRRKILKAFRDNW